MTGRIDLKVRVEVEDSGDLSFIDQLEHHGDDIQDIISMALTLHGYNSEVDVEGVWEDK